MARMKGGRVVRKRKGKPASATAAMQGPAWKPPKPAEGNYGKLVSAAAKARNAARKTTPAIGSAQPTTGGGITSPGFRTPGTTGPRGGKPPLRITKPSSGLMIDETLQRTITAARKRTRY